MKKTLSILLSILMVFSAFSVMPFSAFAESETATTGSGTESDPWVVHNWAALKEKMALGGYIRLGEDAVDPVHDRDSALSVPGGIPTVLDLNGFTVNRNLTSGIRYGYAVNVNGTLDIKDSVGTGKITGANCNYYSDVYGGGIYVSGGTVNLYSGSVSGNTCNSVGGGLYISGGTLNMYGGSISNNTATGNGGGVYVKDGTFNMYGGTISENKSSGQGGGICFDNTAANIKNGSISNNTAWKGGGVYLSYAAKFVMDKGTISENRVTNYGGGVYLYGDNTEFTMNGGTISKNSAGNSSSDGRGGGVMFEYSAKFCLNGGSITENYVHYNSTNTLELGGGIFVNGNTFFAKGSPVIKDNYCLNKSTDVSKANDVDIQTAYGDYVIHLSGTLEEGALIGVSEHGEGVFTKDYNTYNSTDEPSKYFFYNKEGFKIVKNTDGEATVQQIVTHKVTFRSGGGEGTMDPVDVEEGTSYTLPKTCGFTKENRTFFCWKIGNKLYDNPEEKTITVNKDTELTAVWAYSRSTQIDNSVDSSTSTVNGTLKLTDKRTGEVYTKDFSETAPSEFTKPTNSTITAIIEETKAAMLEEAKNKAGKYEVTVLNNDITSLTANNIEDNRKFKGLNPNDADIPEGYLIKDENGDYYRYVTVNGTCSKEWVFRVEFEGEFTSEAPSEPEPQEQDKEQKPEPQKPSAPVLSPEDAALPTAEKTEQTVKNTNTDKGDVAGSLYEPLMLKATTKKKTVTLKWKAQSGADGYIIYGAPCGQKLAKLADVKTTKYTFKKLKKGKYYKYVVVAYKKTAVDNRVLSVSKSVHIATKGGKKGNPTGIKTKKKITLKKGKKSKIKATLLKKGKVATHIAKFRYESSNPAVVTVDKKGKIKALKKGSAKIYVYSQNGICKTVKVKVK